jgi:hypothetical protein
MVRKPGYFLKILLLELKDLEEDIELLMEKLTKSHEKDEVTNYVFMQNLSLMQREIFGIEGFFSELEGLRSDDFETVDDIAEAITRKMEVYCKEHFLPTSCEVVMRRKIEKIVAFFKDN